MTHVRSIRWSTRLIAALAAVAVIATLATVTGHDATAAPKQKDGCRLVGAVAAKVGDRMTRRQDDALASLVTDKTLTQAQADAVADRIRSTDPSDAGSFADCDLSRLGPGDVVEAVTEVLGIDPKELRSLIADGKSLAEIAADRGIERTKLVSTLQDAIVARIESAQAGTPAAGDTSAQLRDRVATAVDRLVDAHRGDRHADRGGAGTPTAGQPAPDLTPTATT